VLFASFSTDAWLKSMQYPKPISEAYLADLKKDGEANDENDDKQPVRRLSGDISAVTEPINLINAASDSIHQRDAPDSTMRFQEKRRLYWAGKTCTT
jgi:hypothetical protein